jgi:hypothetical protein
MRPERVVWSKARRIKVIVAYANGIAVVSQSTSCRSIDLVLVFKARYGFRKRTVAVWSCKGVVEGIWACGFGLVRWFPRVGRLSSLWRRSACGWCSIALRVVLIGCCLLGESWC